METVQAFFRTCNGLRERLLGVTEIDVEMPQPSRQPFDVPRQQQVDYEKWLSEINNSGIEWESLAS
jgi:hypothetical protein